MTETANMPENHDVNWLAFGAAFVLGPIATTVLTFWAAIPVYALILGGPFYLVLGLPLAIYSFRKHGPAYAPLIGFSLLSLLVIPVFGVALSLFAPGQEIWEISLFISVFGVIFAPIWSAMFVWIYKLFTGPEKVV